MTVDNEIGFSISDDRKKLTLFTGQQVRPDITMLRRFASVSR